MKKFGFLLLLFALLLVLGAMACGNSDETPTPKPTLTPTAEPTREPVTITIGNHTDNTGVSSNAMAIITMALEDMVTYYNDQKLIPGVEFKVLTYDGQYNPARDIPGYEWLKERGADLFFSGVASIAVTLKNYLEEDKIVLFTLAPTEEVLVPPGYVFSPGQTLGKMASYSLLKWIAENDPDFPTDRPAKIGGAYWAESFGESILAGAEEYTETHPDQYEWEGGYLTNFTFAWGPEVEALKDCDYVLPPIVMASFVEEYRNAGHTAKFIGTDAQTAFFGMIDDKDLWEEVDSMLLFRHSRWWNEEGTVIDLNKKLLYEYHTDDAEKIIREGSGYLAVYAVYILFELIADAVEAVGSENFNSQAIYDSAQSFSLTIDGDRCASFSETKRAAQDYFAIYEIHGAEQDLFRISPEWVPIQR